MLKSKCAFGKKKNIFFSAIYLQDEKLLPHALACKSRPQDSVEEGEDHSEREHLAFNPPAAHRYWRRVPESSTVVLLCTWKSVKATLHCVGWSELTREATPPPLFIYSLIFRGVCPAPQSSHDDSL